MNSSPSQPGQYRELFVEVPRSAVDAVCNFIIDNICSGLILEDEDDFPLVGIRFYVADGEKVPASASLLDYLGQLQGDLIDKVPPVNERLIRAAQWEEEYRKSVKPVTIDRDIVVRPPWFAPDPGTRYDVVIEPKMAFGTGHHESTRSCLGAIRRHFQPGGRFLDVGCGSGVLSIMADKMGAVFVKAVDIDTVAIENCRENFVLNALKARYEILHGSLERCVGDQAYDFVCTNIIKDTIAEMLPQLSGLVCTGGVLVLSGILDRYEVEMGALLSVPGLSEREMIRDNDWLTYVVFKDH